MRDFFISFNKADRRWAEWIAWELEAAGFTVTLQTWDFRAGASFIAEMNDALRQSVCTLAVISPSYLRSGFGAAEWQTALAEDPTGEKGILRLVRVQPVEPGTTLPGSIEIDLVSVHDEEEARKLLLAGVSRRRPTPVPATELGSRPAFPGGRLESIVKRIPLIAACLVVLSVLLPLFLVGWAWIAWTIQEWRQGKEQETSPPVTAEQPTPQSSPETAEAEQYEPAGEPQLETVGHRRRVWSVSVDAAGRTLATGSADGTVRLWNLADGRLLRILRPAGDSGETGGVRGPRLVAVSPDGELVAAGSQAGIALFMTANGRLVRPVTSLPGTIENLVFSRDGRRLAVAYRDPGEGLLILSVADGKTLWKDEKASVFGIDFDRGGRLVTAGFEGEIRLYDPEMKLLDSTKVERGAFDVSFSPDGKEIAVGSTQIGPVVVLRTTTGLPVDRKLGDMGEWAAVAWSSKGRALFAAHREGDLVRRWTSPADPGTDLRQAFTILDLAPLPDGRLVFGSDAPGWGILDQEGHVDLESAPERVELGSSPLSLSASGDVVEFTPRGSTPSWFSFAEGRLTLGHGTPPENAVMHPPVTSLPGISIQPKDEGWYLGERYISLGNEGGSYYLQPTIIPAGESYEVPVAFVLSGDAIFCGTTWRLIRYDHSGKLVWSESSAIRALNLSRDGRLVVAALRDGRFEWRRADNGELLVTLYVDPDLRRWVAWSPGGDFDTSDGGGNLLGWQEPDGAGGPALWLPAQDVPDHRRPDVLSRLLKTLGSPSPGD